MVDTMASNVNVEENIPDTTDSYRLVFAEIEKEEHLTQVQDLLLQKFDMAAGDLITLGNVGVDSCVQTVSSHLMSQLRRHGLDRNERETLLSYEEMTVTVQLCLAEINKEKYGSFEVEASSVLELHRCLVNDKLQLNLLSGSSNEDYTQLRSKYDEFLKQCNLLDCADLLIRIKEENSVNETLSKHMSQSNFLVVNYTANPIEQAMIRHLLGEKACYRLSVECSLDESFVEGGSLCVETCDIEERINGTHSRTASTPGNISGRSITEKHAEKVLMCYLTLLVNSRSELALAQVFNIPERELDQKGFTALKHEARARKISMFQAGVSHVMRVRLGGKSYAPDRNAPLSQYVKGLAQLTDLVQKLVTIIEEDKDPRSAIRRVLIILKNTIVKCQDNMLRRPSVEAVTEKLQTFAQTTLTSYQQQQGDSPKRDAYHGGSLVGRKTIRVIRAILDRYCARLPSNAGIDCLTDVYSSQSTPLRLPSLFSHFRSPLDSSPEAKESQPLRERMKSKYQKQPSKKQNVPRFQSSMDWALPLHDVGLYRENSMSAVIDDFIPSKTIVHPAEHTKTAKTTQAKKVLESLHDQENAVDGFTSTTSASKAPSQPSVQSSQVTLSQTNQNTKKRGRAGGASQTGGGQPVQKKAKKESKKKALPLQKGQKQLTSFFRL